MNLSQLSSADSALVDSGLIQKLHPSPCKKIQQIQWHLPKEHHLKINCDGSSLGNPVFGGGGFVVRNCACRVLQAGYAAYGICTNMEAEIRAMKDGIEFCHYKSSHTLQVELDSELLVGMILGTKAVPWRYFDDISELRSLVGTYQIQVSHIHREENAVADHLAKLGCSSQVSMVLDCFVLPGILGLLVLKDNFQLPVLRIN